MPHNSVILLVDDDEDSILLLQNALDRAGVANPQVVARDGQEAVDYLSASGIYAGKHCPWPALMLLDLKMPGMDGFQVLEWFGQSKSKKGKALPIAVMTASNNESDRERAMSLGASAFYIKPGSFTDLISMAREIGKRWL
jgi:CheY-like chemotaxis protein